MQTNGGDARQSLSSPSRIQHATCNLACGAHCMCNVPGPRGGSSRLERVALCRMLPVPPLRSARSPPTVRCAVVLCCMWYLLCCMRYLLCCTRYLLCCMRYLLCCMRYLLCCMRYLRGPSQCYRCRAHPCHICTGTGLPPRVAVVRCGRTSIWDETLYRAWSSIVYSLIPDIDLVQEHLASFCNICEADEVCATSPACCSTLRCNRTRCDKAQPC